MLQNLSIMIFSVLSENKASCRKLSSIIFMMLNLIMQKKNNL